MAKTLPSITSMYVVPLFRVVIPLGKAKAGSNATQAPPVCPLPPPLAGNVVRFRIPIEMIRQALLRKQRQTATVSYTPNVARTSLRLTDTLRLTIPLHRIKMPLGSPVTKK
jgi:hypothetical protein